MCVSHIDGVHQRGFQPLESWLEEVRTWWLEFWRFTFIFDEAGRPWFSYNPHLWSIPVEFKGSMIIYTTSLTTSQFSARGRFGAICGLILYYLYAVDGWYGAFFLAGFLLCQMDLARRESQGRKAQSPTARKFDSRTFLKCALFVLGIYLAGVPHCSPAEYLARNPGWHYLSRLKPGAMNDPKWFYLF